MREGNSAVFLTVAELGRRGDTVFVSDRVHTVEEFERGSLAPHRGEEVDAAVIRADYADYADLSRRSCLVCGSS